MNDRATDQAATPPTPEHPGGAARRPFLLGDPQEAPRRARRRLVGTVFVLTVSMIALGTIGARRIVAGWTMRRSFVTTMEDDLRRLGDAQERYRGERDHYGTRADLGRRFVPSQGVTIRVRTADEQSWSATATHARTRTVCVLTVTASPQDGIPPEPLCR